VCYSRRPEGEDVVADHPEPELGGEAAVGLCARSLGRCDGCAAGSAGDALGRAAAFGAEKPAAAGAAAGAGLERRALAKRNGCRG
jgi:hypothetical protein